MPKKPHPTHSGTIVANEAELTIDDLCNACGLPKDKIVTYVGEGIIEPAGDTIVEWRFSRTTIIELHRAQRLEQDLGLNEAGIALALELLSQIDTLKRRLERLDRGDRQNNLTDIA